MFLILDAGLSQMATYSAFGRYRMPITCTSEMNHGNDLWEASSLNLMRRVLTACTETSIQIDSFGRSSMC